MRSEAGEEAGDPAMRQHTFGTAILEPCPFDNIPESGQNCQVLDWQSGGRQHVGTLPAVDVPGY
jgi:hypothetical protein